MYEQLNIFSFLEEAPQKAFSWDDDINEIHKRLLDLARKHELDVGKQERSIWEHAKEYGYRMSVGIRVTREIMEDERFLIERDNIVDFAKTKNIELSPMYGGVFFYRNENRATLSFYSNFMDKARRKRKSW